MERKTTLPLLFLLCVLLSYPVALWAEKMEPPNFRYASNLKGEFKKGGVYRMMLPSEVLQQSDKSSRDIRLFDKENREIPFVILDNRIPAKKTIPYPLEVVSYNDQAEKTKIVLKRATPIEPITMLELESQDRDFNKAVAVSGSNDMKHWKTLGQEAIYDFSSRVNLRKMRIALGKNTYPYLQLIIDEGKEKASFQNIRLKYDGMDFSAATYTKKKLKINRFFVFDDAETREKVVYDELTLVPPITTDAEKQRTEISFHTNIPFSTVEFGIDHPYYYRPLKLYAASTNRKEDFVTIKQDSLYNLPISNQTEMKKHFNVAAPQEYRFYRIVIENEANPPLKIESMKLKWVQKQLFFIALEDHQEYWLCWGSPTIEEVRYDIAKVIRADNWFTQPSEAIQIYSITQNANYKPFKVKGDKTLIEKNILVIVVILVVMVVAFFLYQLWKKTG